MAAEIEPAFCPNCGAALGGAYCAACGQKVGALNPTVGEFLRDLAQELLNVDGRIFRSGDGGLTWADLGEVMFPDP